MSHNTKLTLDEIIQIRDTMRTQNHWRRKADRESDYHDGNQLDAPALKRLADRGVPPAIEPLIGVALNIVFGVEVKSRTDFVSLADDAGGESSEASNVAKATGFKLKKTEKRSGCDRACTAGFEELAKVGAGFVEISKDPDPFKYPIRVNPVHRNEIWWDNDNPTDRLWKKNKWVVRERSVKITSSNIALFKDLLKTNDPLEDLISEGSTRQSFNEDYEGLVLKGIWGFDRGFAIEERHLYSPEKQEIRLTEILYRRWAKTKILRTDNNRVIEYDQKDATHQEYLDAGAEVFEAVTSRVRQAFVVGTRIISDDFSPMFRDDFHYAPFFGYIEDRTGTPYGEIRKMIYLQDEINSRTSKMQWLLSAIRSIRPDGMVLADDDTFRDEVGRADGDILLDPEWIENHPNAAKFFSIDFLRDVTQEQYNRLQDARQSLFAVVGITPAMRGQATGGVESGSGYNSVVDQSALPLAKLFDYNNLSRENVGNLLLKLDSNMIQDNYRVLVESDLGVKETITLNQINEDSRKTNDVQQYTMHVELAEVPSTPTYRSQMMSVLSENIKSMDKDVQHLLLPFLLNLMPAPGMKEAMKEVREKMEMPNREQIDKQIEEGIANGIESEKLKLEWAKLELDTRTLDYKEAHGLALTDKTEAETVNIRSDGLYSNVKTAQEIVLQPGVAPVAEELHRSAGGEDMNPAPVFQTPVGPVIPAQPVEARPLGVTPQPDMSRQNTSPQFPPRTSGQQKNVVAPEPDLLEDIQPESSMKGIEKTNA